MRALCFDDWPRLWEIDQHCFTPAIAFPKAEFRRLMRIPHPFHIAAENDAGEITGFLLSTLERQRGHIITIDVLPEQRQHGIGTVLMQSAEKHFRPTTQGMRLEVAVNNPAAIAFYMRLGYHIIRDLPAYYAADLDGLRLEKDW